MYLLYIIPFGILVYVVAIEHYNYDNKMLKFIHLDLFKFLISTHCIAGFLIIYIFTYRFIQSLVSYDYNITKIADFQKDFFFYETMLIFIYSFFFLTLINFVV